MASIIYILFIHWIGDFVLQPNHMGKSYEIKSLLTHTLLYTAVWFSFLIFFITVNQEWNIENLLSIAGFLIITFISHTVIDYYTSKAHIKLCENQKYFEFFASVGFDQFLHYLQLFLTISWLWGK
jgi:hypothetical protein